MQILRNLRVATLVTFVTTILLGVVYPLVITAVAQALFPRQANGGLIERHGVVVGSRLIGQAFRSPGYFHSRPSATTVPYDAANSGGSNYGPTNRKLIETVAANVQAARSGEEDPDGPVPVDLVTASASGVDPHISPAAAAYQVPRIARERGVSESDIRRVVAAHTESRTFGVLGEARVNVLELNLALDDQLPMHRGPQ